MKWNGQADDNEKRCESDRVSFGRSMNKGKKGMTFNSTWITDRYYDMIK